ncbi:MAG TPA: hypothetical protein VG673_02305, partial [Actinomycetota bacterium]|nr:hypothetical protein [Actinomycetota bacterium]
MATKALAPAWRARIPPPTPSAEENITTWTSGSCWRMRAVAASPSRCGMRQSISTTSGRSVTACSTPWAPSTASPTTGMPASSSSPAAPGAWP